MMEQMTSGLGNMDKFISHEGGIPCATNIMACGDPGVGKTTILLLCKYIQPSRTHHVRIYG